MSEPMAMADHIDALLAEAERIDWRKRRRAEGVPLLYVVGRDPLDVKRARLAALPLAPVITFPAWGVS